MKLFSIGLFLAAAVLMSSAFTANISDTKHTAAISFKDSLVYRDGTYTGRSQAMYTDEPYWGTAVVKIVKGKIARVTFTITDTAKNEPFNEAYKKYFKGNDEYVQQCINDAGGMKEYPKKLVRAQDMHRVDAISGATWSYNIFKASVEDALRKAIK